MSSFKFPERKWHSIQLLSFLLKLFLTFKQTHCAGGGQLSSSSSNKAIAVVVDVVEVYGITEANLDQMYTQLLLDTDDVKEPGAFIEINCRLSTFLFVHKIIEISQNTERLDNWLKDKEEENKNEEEEAKRKINIHEFRTRNAEFKKMWNEKQFDGPRCHWNKFFVLGDLCDMLQQMLYGIDIDHVQIGRRMDESEKAHKARLKANVGLIHGDALLQLVDKPNSTQSILIHRILHDQLLEDTEQGMLAIKRRLRLVVGEYMFGRIELREPIVFRIDLIVPAHLLSLYRKILSLDADTHAERNLRLQISISRTVRIILDLKRGQQGEMEFMVNFQNFWKNNVRKLASQFPAVMSKLKEYWKEFHSDSYNNSKLADPLAELNDLLLKEERKAVLQLFHTEKLGEMFKQFLDGIADMQLQDGKTVKHLEDRKKGAKGRLIAMMGYGLDAHKFVRENQELAKLLVDGDRLHEKLLGELIKAYIGWFCVNSTNIESQKAQLVADVLLQIRQLELKFGKTKLRDQWTLYRVMFLIFVDQLEDAMPGFMHAAGALYKKMLFKLRDLKDHDDEPINIESVLSKEFAALIELCVAEDGKGTIGSQTAAALMSVDEQQLEERMKNDHREMMRLMKGTENEEKMNSELNPESRKKLDAYVEEEVTTSNVNLTSENPIDPASSSISSTSARVPISSNYYYECKSKENEQKTINDFQNDPGFDEFTAYRFNLILPVNYPAREEWEKKVHLYMAVLHYGNVIGQINSSIGEKFPEEFDALEIVWKVTENLEANDKKLLEQKLCKYFRYIYHSIYKFLAENDREHDFVIELLFQIKMTIGFPEDVDTAFLIADDLHCDNADSPGIANKMINIMENEKEKKETINFLYLDFLLKKHEVFNAFFCGQKDLRVKDRLHELLGAKSLELLERLHPDVLKIHHFQDDVRFYLYEQFLENRKNSTEAFAAECRLTFTLALGRLEIIEQLQMEKTNWSKLAQEAVMKKANWLKKHMFFANPNELASAQNICILISFRNFVRDMMMQMMKKQKDSKAIDEQHKTTLAIGQIALWNGVSDCTDNPAFANMVVLQQRTELSDEHKIYLCSHRERAEPLTTTMGHYTRLLRLIPGFVELKLKYDKRLLALDSIKRNHIQAALLEEDEEGREMYRLGLSFISWIHWMDTQLDKNSESRRQPVTQQQIMHEIWNNKERQHRIISQFDAIYDAHLSELHGQFGLGLARMQYGLRELVLNWRESKIKSIGKWRQMLEKQMDMELRLINDASSVQQWKEGNKQKEFESWIQGLNRQEMFKQLRQRPTKEAFVYNDDVHKAISWRLLLKETLEEDKHARKRLLTLFGRVRTEIEPILEAIPLEAGVVDELGLIENEEESRKDEETVLVNEKQKKTDFSEVVNISSSKKKKNNAAEESSHQIHKHHGSSKQQNVMKESEQCKSIVGSSEAKKAENSNSQIQAQKTEDESAVHDAMKISAISDEPKVKGKAAGEAQLEVHHMVVKKGKSKGKSGVAALPMASPLLASSPSSLPKETLSVVDQRKKLEEMTSSSPSIPSVITADAVESRSREIDATAPLLDILREKGYIETPELKHRIERAVEEMRTIVHDCNNDAVLLVGGSYLLQLHTAHSDIDAVLLLPFEEKNADDWIQLCQQQFFGHQQQQQFGEINNNEAVEIICDLEKPEKECDCPDSSLYCILNKNPAITVLLRMNGRDGVPMLILKFRDIDFDISFVPMSKEKLKKFYAVAGSNKKQHTLEMSLSSVQNCDILIACFMDLMSSTKNNDNRKGMLLPLSGYRANLYMRELLNVKPTGNALFQPAMLALKLWAKNNFVYGGLFGLLNGSTLTTMLLYVFTKNNHDSVPSLLEDFFDTFYNWKWPEIVELDRALNVDPYEYGGYDWTENVERNERGNLLKAYKYRFLQKEHAKLVWPVIVPGFPTQNASFNVNGWTKQAILRKFGQALAKMKNLRKQIGAGNNKQPTMKMIREKWDKWLKGGEFKDKYDNFVAIVCAANSAQQMDKFCDYVETRIRLQLLFSFGDLSERVLQWMHASPIKVRNGISCTTGIRVVNDDGHWLCTIWLVGIELVEGKEKEDIRQLLEDNLIEVHTDVMNEWNESAAQEKTSRLENFTEEIHESFKFKEGRRLSSASSPPELHNGSNSDSTSTRTIYGAESPRHDTLLIESPRGSPSNRTAPGSPRQYMPPTRRHWSMASPSITRQDSISSPSQTHQDSSMPKIEKVEADINEKLWAKYLDKAQLRAWLKEMVV